MALVWFITGVSSGFGLQIALKALERGHRVIGTVRDRQKASTEVKELESKGGKVLDLDVANAKACFDVWQSAEKIYGRIDVLCNNAGMSYVGALEDFRWVWWLVSDSGQLSLIDPKRWWSSCSDGCQCVWTFPFDQSVTARIPKTKNRDDHQRVKRFRHRRSYRFWVIRSV